MSIIYYHTMPTFEHYFQPETVTEAMSLLVRYGEEAKILAGGTDLLVLMRSRSVVPKCVVDITGLPGLDYIKKEKTDTLKIGALATLRAVELSDLVKEEYPLLNEAVTRMANTQIRNMATVVGNICRASPSADTAPPLLALEASVEISGPDESRIVPLESFFTGPGETILKPSEMVTEILVPKLRTNTGTAFLRATRVAADLAKVSAASVVMVEDGTCKVARIALGGVAPTPIRARNSEDLLMGNKLDDRVIEEAASLAVEESKPISDVRSTEEYRREICKVLVSRAIKTSLERAQTKVGR